ncbi:MAG: cytochrome c [Planctomycetia bacterium]|nr:cytochrome c [Planctomycetia bacterium]
MTSGALIRFTIAIGCLMSAAQAAADPAPRRAAARPKAGKLAPPPKWDRAVLETFFTDAREHLGPGPAPGSAATVTSTGGAGGTPATSGTATDAAADTTPPVTLDPAAAPADGSSGRWSALVAPATLEDEVKAQVRPVAAAVQTPTAFKGGGYKAAREEFSLLAVLFGVIGQYDGDVRFKRDAVNLRSLFGRSGFNCKVGTDNSFAEAKQRSQDLAEVVRGGSIEDRKADAEFRWPETVNRPPLMKRMELSLRERLGPWTSNQNEFNKNRGGIIHEAQLLAVLAEVIKADGYEYADDATYREYVETLQQLSLEVVEAAKSNDFSKAQSAAGQINKRCDACHGDFRS